MDSDLSKNKASLTSQESEDDQISRRSLLEVAAKSAAGLTMMPLVSIVADEQKAAMVSDLLTDNSTPTVRASSDVSSANSGACLVGDLNGDKRVDEYDLKIMSEEWLSSDKDAISNLDNSFTYIPGSASSAIYVDSRDYSLLAKNWKVNCSGSSAVNLSDMRKAGLSRFCRSSRYPRPDC